MKLDEFKKMIIAEREATRQQNLDKILSVANATIQPTTTRKEN